MHMEWYYWAILTFLLCRIPFLFVRVQRLADDTGGTSDRRLILRAIELIAAISLLVALLAHGTGSW